MTRLALRTAMVLLIASLGQGWAQSPAQSPAQAPQIEIELPAPSPEVTPPEAPATVAPTSDSTAPATPPIAASPQPTEPPNIYLAPPAPDAADVTAAPQTAEMAAATAPAPAQDWLLSLVPAARPVPTEVQIGGSMPEVGHFRLTGETASAEFQLSLPGTAPLPDALLLSLRSSVNVLPDGARLTLWINDTEAGTLPLDNFGPFAQQSLPSKGLRHGENKIRIDVVQPHRIYCGPEASFAVWTEIDLRNSGILTTAAELPLNAQSFMAALQAQITDTGTLDLLTDGSASTETIRDVAHWMVGALGELPQIREVPFYQMRTGPAPKAQIALVASDAPMASFRRGAEGTLTLQIEYAGDRLPELSKLLPQLGTGWGIPQLTPGQLITQEQLGFNIIRANTRYFRQDVSFLLPEDWLLLASQKVQFNLHYGHSADLPKGALLLFKVNGQTVRLLPLDSDGGKVLPPLPIAFRANRLNPGINTITYEMTVPGDPTDLPCTPRNTDMLVILGDTDMTVPPSPKMTQTDMSRSLARLGGSDVVIPEELATQPQNAETLIAFGALFRPLVQDGVSSTLHIVGLDGVGLVPVGRTGVTRRMLQNAVYPATQFPLVLPSEPEMPAATAFALADATGAPAPDVSTSNKTPRLWDSVRGFFATDGLFFNSVGGVRDIAFPATVSLPTWLAGKTGSAMLLQLDPTTPEDIWLIAGPDISMTDLALQVDKFRRAGRGDVHGQVAILQANGEWTTWSEKRRPELLEPLSMQNIRAVLGNYASWSPVIFATFTLFFALLSVVPALLFVLKTRRSGSRT
jgi:cellulose synthase operon protein B